MLLYKFDEYAIFHAWSTNRHLECQNHFTSGKAMNTAQPKSILQIVCSKSSTIFLTLLLTVSGLLNTPTLDAGGWGTIKEVVEQEDITWQGVYHDLNGLHFTALLPNYQSGQLNNGMISLYGVIDDIGYVIMTPFMSHFNPPKSSQKFTKMIQNANPEFIVTSVENANLGVKYIVDLIPVDQNSALYWRFMTTENRLIKMGTEDTNENRRQIFFDSIKVK